MEKNKRGAFLIKNTVLFAIGNFSTKFISFFLVPLYTNMLSTTEYGIVDLIFTICTVLAPILTLNISEAILRFMLDENADNNKIMSIGLSAVLTSILTSLIVIPISMFSEPISQYKIYFYFYLITLISSNITLIILRAKKMVLKYSIGNIIHSLAIATLNIIFLLVFKMKIEGYFLAYILANLITTIYVLIAGGLFKDLKDFKIDYDLLKKMLKYSIVLIPTSFLLWIIKASDRIVITKFLGVAESGIYAISYKLPFLLSNVMSIINNAWMYSAIAEEESEDNTEYTNRIYNYLFAIIIILASGLLMIIKPFLGFYVSAEYYESWIYTPFLTIGTVFWALAAFIATAYKVNKDSKGILISVLIAAISNLILNFILIPILGVIGAAIATCISYILLYIYRIIDTAKYIKIKITTTQIFSIILLILTAATVYIENSFGQLLLIIEFLIMVLILKKTWYPILKNLITKVLGKIKRK